MGVRIFFALLTLAVLGLAVASLFYILEKVEKPKVASSRAIKESAAPKPIDPGIREFEAAVELIKNRQLVAARDKLRYIIRYFPLSKRQQGARRLCSEINLDLLISPNFSDGKVTYEVKRGDSLSGIAKKHDSTIECLKRLNGMMDFKIIPGDQLLIRSLDFKVTVDTGKKLLLIKESDEFFAEYAIESAHLPSNLRLPYDDSVRSKQAIAGKSVLSTTQGGYDIARKEVRLGRGRMSILSREEASEEGQPDRPGIVMDPADVEELTMLLRVSAPIQVL